MAFSTSVLRRGARRRCGRSSSTKAPMMTLDEGHVQLLGLGRRTVDRQRSTHKLPLHHRPCPPPGLPLSSPWPRLRCSVACLHTLCILTTNGATTASSARNCVCDLFLSRVVPSPHTFCYTGKDKKKATKQKTQQAQQANEDFGDVSPADVKEAVAKLQAEELPSTQQEKEAFLMTQLSVAEQCVSQG